MHHSKPRPEETALQAPFNVWTSAETNCANRLRTSKYMTGPFASAALSTVTMHPVRDASAGASGRDRRGRDVTRMICAKQRSNPCCRAR